MKKKYQYNANLPTRLLVPQILVIFVLLALCMQTVFAQSGCVENEHGILKCDLSVSLIEKYTGTSGITTERAWYTTPSEVNLIREQLKHFAEVWCELSLGKSRISKISVLSGYRKSSSDVALYNNIGRSYSYVGAFPELNPSIVLYYPGFYDRNNIDRYLGRVLAHEFAHATLKVYDEYREPGVYSSWDCLDPLQSDDPRATIMNSHINYSRFSHPIDYANTPPAQTAQYRCYGESAWEVLVQPERCDSNLSLDINAWMPRQDYFAKSYRCSPSVPSIAELENPKNKHAVVSCINKTKKQLEINFFSGSQNTVFVIDSAIKQSIKSIVGDGVKSTLGLLTAYDKVEDIRGGLFEELNAEFPELNLDLQNLEIPEPPPQRYIIRDFQDSDIPDVDDIARLLVEQRREVDETLKNDPKTRERLDSVLNTMESIFSGIGKLDLLNELEKLENISEMDFINMYSINTVVMISDTQTLPSTRSLSFFKENGIPIHTIGIGDTVNPGLNMLSEETGGNHFTMPEPNLIELDSVLARNHHPDIHTTNGTITVDGNHILPLQMLQESQFLIVFLFGYDNSRLDEVSYVKQLTPTKVVDSDTRTLLKNESSIGFVVINNHEAGLLNVLITGSGSFDYRTFTIGSIDMSLNTGTEVLPRQTEGTPLIYPAPIPIIARVHGHIPILNAKVKAEITTPNSNFDPVELELLDNGVSPDFRSGDGVYSGVMRDYSKYGDGIYHVKAVASNPDGSAVFDDTGIATFGTTQSEISHKAPPFHRVMHSQLEVRGTQTAMSNTDFSTPRDIETEGVLNWGIIEARGHTNWYRFKVNSGGLHYMQTSNLLSHGTVQMATDMVLYEPNLNGGDPSFLAASTDYRGTNVSHIEHPLDAGKDYLISVSHANSDRGAYGLTVNSENSLLSTHEVNRSINSSAGGGGPVDYLFLVMLLTLLYARSSFRLKILSLR